MICRLGRCWRVVYGLGMVELGLRVEQEMMMMMKSLNHHCYYPIFWESSSVSTLVISKLMRGLDK